MASQDCLNNPWAQYLGLTNLNELENIAEAVEKDSEKTLWWKANGENAKLSNCDMHVYGYCPVMEELKYVLCRICQSLLLPSALQQHIDIRHKIEETTKDTIPELTSIGLPKQSNLCSNFSPPQLQRSQYILGESFSENHCASTLERNSPVNLVKMTPSSNKNKLPMSSSTEDFDLSFSESVSPTELLHRLELSLYQQARLLLPDTSSCSIPSTSSDLLPPATNSFMPFQNNMFHRELRLDCDLQSNQPSSTTTLSSDSVQEEKKTPVLEKLVLRRVPHSGENSSDEKRKSVEGRDGSKKRSSGPYFMVVKNKESSQNLLHTSKQLLQQSQKLYHEKFTVDRNLKNLFKAKDKLISKLLMELQSVRKRLNQSKRSGQELRSKLLVLSDQLKQIKQISDSQCEVLSSKNCAYEEEIRDLKSKLDQLQAQRRQLHSYFPPHHYPPHGDARLFQHEMAQQLQSSDQQKTWFEKRLRDLEAELLTTKTNKKELESEMARFYQVVNDFRKNYLDCQNQYEGQQQHDGLYTAAMRCSDVYDPSSYPSSSTASFVDTLGAIDYRTYHRNTASSDTNDSEVS